MKTIIQSHFSFRSSIAACCVLILSFLFGANSSAQFYDFNGSTQGWTSANAGVNCLGTVFANTWALQGFGYTGNSFGTTAIGGEHSYIISPTLTFPSVLCVSAQSYSNNESGYPCTYDVEYVEYSTDGGTTWTPFFTTYQNNLHGYGMATWNTLNYVANVTPTANGRIRFRYDTGDGCCGPGGQTGWYLDNVNIGLLATPDCNAVGYTDLTGPCAASVCGYDSFCCNTAWDSICATEASTDGNCVYCLSTTINSGCADPNACNYSDPAYTECIVACTYPGCTNPASCNYDPNAGCDNGSCLLYGCTDFFACNYNPAAGCFDGSCTYPGCTNPGACNYMWWAGCDDGSCLTDYGCTDGVACNYNPAATCSDGSCVYPCTNPSACNYGDCAACIYPIGAGSANYCLYDANGTCAVEGDLCSNGYNYFGGAVTQTALIGLDGISSITITLMYTDCTFGGTQDVFLNGNNVSSVGYGADCLCSGPVTITLSGAQLASQIGGTDQLDITWTYLDYLAVALVDVTYGPTPISGCTDPVASNYNPAANCDDGSCNYVISVDTNCNTPFCDISSSGLEVFNGCDDCTSGVVDMGISFTYGCNTYTTAEVNNNGTISLGSGYAGFFNSCFPSTGTDLIAPWWDDLYVGICHIQTIGSRFIVQWTSEQHFSGTGGTITFQVILDSYDNSITFVYLDTTFGTADDFGASATVGIEMANGFSYTYSCNTASLYDGQCIHIQPQNIVCGCADPSACNYSGANLDDGSCIYPCTDDSACNYGACEACYYQCTNPMACNYGACEICSYPPGSGVSNYCIYQGNISGSCVPTGDLCNDGYVYTNSISTIIVESGVSQIEVATSITTCAEGGNFEIRLNGVTVYSIPNTGACSCAAGVLFVTLSGAQLAPLTGGGSDLIELVHTNFGYFGSSNANVIYGPAPVYGCNDIYACNYDASACPGGPCFYTPGCNDPTACNYEPSAECNDGSCVYFTIPSGACNQVGYSDLSGPCAASVCGYDGYCCNIAWDSLCASEAASDPNCVYCVFNLAILGCTISDACNFNPAANCNDGSCAYSLGCTDGAACNYDPGAACDDGSCYYACSDPGACNYGECNPCSYPAGSGASNYCIYQGYNTGSCVPTGDLCNDGYVYTNSISTIIVDSGVSQITIATSITTCGEGGNFEIRLNGVTVYSIPNTGTCTCAAGVFFVTLTGAQLAPLTGGGSDLVELVHTNFGYFGSSNALVNYGPASVQGCTDPSACNYNSSANCDDGSCSWAYGCTDPGAYNYDPSALCDNGSCIYAGCTYPGATNYDPTAGVDDGSCLYSGCTDPMASNYNSLATIDDGSCIYPVYGCTYPDAQNYDPMATVDDGSCICPDNTCPADLDGNGVINVSDLLSFMSYFGTVCP